ncbi:MAG: ATP-binding protein [Candidatus Woesearchaeota archaeon]
MTKIQIIAGSYGELIARKKQSEALQIGELLVLDGSVKQLVQVFDLYYGSQISQQNLELISGMHLEQQEDVSFLEPELRNYTLAKLKPLLEITNTTAKTSKKIPDFFGSARQVTKEDFSFLHIPSSPLSIGNLRSGTDVLDVSIALDAKETIAHHLLIPATTGKGKSNLMKHLLWNLVDSEGIGILVLDPHDEYYGRHSVGIGKHPSKKVVYYTAENPPLGTYTLKLAITDLKPHHFSGVVDFSNAQLDALYVYYNKFGNQWVEEILKGTEIEKSIQESTQNVLKRKMQNLLGIQILNNTLEEQSIFSKQTGQATLKNIVNDIMDAKIVIVDTSSLFGSSELLVSSIITHAIFEANKKGKKEGKDIPTIGVVLEEAPRVLGKEVLEKGHNIFSTIAREGRKFKVGLFAITQLPSLIPRAVLSNMNTKIILGLEMAQERQAIIDSAAQDLSTDSRMIASLDKGEAIVSSNFARFAIPVTIPLFNPQIKENTTRLKL